MLGAVVAFPLSFLGAKNINRLNFFRLGVRRGYDVIRAVERSEELQQKLADARTIEETAADSRYLENLEERVRELEAENKRLRERIGGRQNVALDEVGALLRELHQKVDRLAPGETRASGRGV